MERQLIIETYETLITAISNYERGRSSKEDMTQAYREYKNACHAIHEPYFILEDIASDDMSGIPAEYPHNRPAMEQIGGAWSTKRRLEKYARFVDLVKKHT